MSTELSSRSQIRFGRHISPFLVCRESDHTLADLQSGAASHERTMGDKKLMEGNLKEALVHFNKVDLCFAAPPLLSSLLESLNMSDMMAWCQNNVFACRLWS